jgi:hypothetical protein
MYELLSATCAKELFFRREGKLAALVGAIGYLRIDFGKGGNEFHTSWFDILPELKSYEFKRELDDVINSLREDGEHPLKDRKSLSEFCKKTSGEGLDRESHGYEIQTPGYSYYFRLKPSQDDYDCYCFCCDNSLLLAELTS